MSVRSGKYRSFGLRTMLVAGLVIVGCSSQVVVPDGDAGASTSSAGTTTGPGGATAATGADGATTTGAGGATTTGAGGEGPACVSASDCAIDAPECRTATCKGGTCSFNDIPMGTPLLAQTPGDCAEIVCDGTGHTTVVLLASDAPDDAQACTLDACEGLVPTHTLMPEAPCYTGPPGSMGVGLCAPGTQPCDAQGQPSGACVGSVTPQPEVCDLAGLDENCDGQVNEAAAGCSCGDGVVSFGEECDDGNLDPDDACTPVCKPPQCGDGFVQPALGEQCDDGGTSNADPCSSTCQVQRVARVVVGSAHSCALLEDGRIKCWGWGASGQLGLGNADPHGEPPNSMGVKLPAVDLGAGRSAVSVATGFAHTCALLDDASVKCWGYNANGELGLGDKNNRGDGPGEMGDNLPAVELGAGRTAVAIAAGASFTCAVLDDGSVKCWGYNGVGQLGLGDKNNRGDEDNEMGDNLPAVSLGAGKTAVGIAAGSGHVCARLSDGGAKCWGFNYPGQLGLGDTINRGDDPNEMGDNLPEVALGAGALVAALALGDAHTCALLTDGSVKCWGANTGGMLGVGDSVNHGDQPFEMADKLPKVNLGTGLHALTIAAGEYHTCAVLSNAALKCWGDGSYGRLGLENVNAYGYDPSQMGDALPAVNLGTGATVKGVASLDKHSCAVLTNGSVKCWGDGNSGKLGFSTGAVGSQAGTMGDNLPTVKLFSNQW